MSIYNMTEEERRRRIAAAQARNEQRYAFSNYVKSVKDASVEAKRQQLIEERAAEDERYAQPWLVRGLHTAGDILGNVATGFVKAHEGIVDFGIGTVGLVGGMFNKDFQEGAKKAVAYDWTGRTIGDPINSGTKYSFLNDGPVGNVGKQVASGVGQMLPAVIAAAVTYGAGAAGAAAGIAAEAAAAASATKAAETASLLTLAASAAGNSTEEAFNDGAGYLQGYLYGVASGAIEAGTEKMWGGLGKLTGAGILDGVTKNVARTGIARVAKEALEEGTEEIVAELASPAAKMIYKGTDALNEYKTGDYWKRVGEAGLVGGLTSLAYGGTIGHTVNTIKGVDMDVDAVNGHLGEIEDRRQQLFNEGKLTSEELQKQKTVQLQDYEKMSQILQKKGEKQREKLLQNYRLTDVFENDGTIKPDARAALESEVTLNNSLSLGLQGKESEISEMLSKEGAKICESELTAEEQKEYTAFKTAFQALSEKHLLNTEFVLAESMPEDRAFLSDYVIVIGKDQLASSSAWSSALAHEVTHFAEGSEAYEDFMRFVIKYTTPEDLESTKNDVLLKYFKGDEAILESLEKALDENGSLSGLTEEQKKFLTELAAHQSEKLFGSEKMIAQLSKKRPGLARRLLRRIRDFISALGKGKETKAARDYLRAAEILFDRALNHAGEKKTDTDISTKPKEANASDTIVPKYAYKSIAQDLVEFVKSVWGMKDKTKLSKRKKKLGEVSERHAQLVGIALKKENISIDVSDYSVWIDGGGVRHIEIRHGENGKQDISMSSAEDVSKIFWMINNADSAEIARENDGSIDYAKGYNNSDNTQAIKIILTYKNNDGTYTVAECVPESASKRIYVISAYKNGDKGQPLNMEQRSPQATSKTLDDGITTTNSISQNAEKSTPEAKKSDGTIRHAKKRPILDPDGKPVSQGQADRAVANATRERVYTREDTKKILMNAIGVMDASDEKTELVGVVRGKSFEEITTELYKLINTVDKDRRASLAQNIANLILKNAKIKEALSDPENERHRRVISALRPYLHRIDLRSIKADIKSHYDKDNSPFARWGWQNGKSRVGADEVAQALEGEGIRVETRSGNEADLFVELDRMYREARAALKKSADQMFADALTGEELQEQRRLITKKILEELDKGGKPSEFAKFNNAKYWADVAKAEKGKNKALFELKTAHEKLIDFKLGTFFNKTEFRGDTFKSTVERLAGIFRNGKLSDTTVRKLMKQLAAWYTPKNEMLSDAYNQDLADSISEIAYGDPDTELSVREMNLLTNVMQGLLRFAENYNKVWYDGKWAEVKPLAKTYVDQIRDTEKNKVSVLEKLRKTAYFEEFADPMTIARMYDGYTDGFFTYTFKALRRAGLAAAIEEMDTLKEYTAFTKKHKKYLKTIEKERVGYRGHLMLRSEAIGLYMTYKRKQAQAGLLINGFTYTDEKEKVGEASGVLTDNMWSTEELERAALKERKALEKLLTAEDREFVAILERGYEAAKKLKAREDLNRYGYTNVLEDYYYPLRRANIAQNVDKSELEQEYNRVTNASFNKDTVEGAKQKLEIRSADQIFRRHVKLVSLYANLTNAIDAYNKLYNYAVNENRNDPISVKTAAKNVWTDWDAYVSKLISDIQGITPTKGKSKVVSFLRGSYAKFQLGANPKTWATQLSSLFAGSSILDITSIMRGMTMSGKDVDTYCRLAELRNSDDTAAAAQGVLTDKLDDLSAVLMKPIAVMDRFVVSKLFAACQVQIEKNGGGKIGTEQNKKAAGELLTEVILETQQNSFLTERSAAMRSGSEWKKAITMFTADSMKVVGRVIDGIGEYTTLKKHLKNAAITERATLETQLKAAGKKARKAVAALVGSAVYMALIAKLFQKLYGKKEEEEPGKAFVLDIIGNMLGGLPLIKDVYAFFAQGFEMNNYAYSTINDMMTAVKDTWNTAGAAINGDATKRDWAKLIRNLLYSAGGVTGIPIRNMQNILHGVLSIVAPNAAYRYDAMLYAQSYKKDLQAAIEAGDDARANTIIDLMIGEKSGDVKDERVKEALRGLTKAGYSVLPRSIGKTVTVDGEEIVLTKKQKESMRKINGAASDAVKDLVQLSEFQKSDEETRTKAIKWIYDTYYNLALEDVIGDQLESKNVLFAEAISIEKLAIILAAARSITADVDRRGNPIAGSKKKKIEQYVASLRLTVAQKYMIMGYLGYANKNGRAEVNAYINTLRISKDEKALLLQYSGY